ncbi:hypothetical protein [Sutcliffiella sp. NC1]|uniref:hypothetical protein n=1 Tax=Sutcliffiella sp. NC1 TaxID=3004096 RepID=UPI0022DCE44F|nr:hypothetical protein [Sutcliffiella sp. NC1]WBL14468.1 hypothetical protein O1A01_21740 [Sutcliffiella sp. NC1]
MKIWKVSILFFLMVACSNSSIPIKVLDLDYLDERALHNRDEEFLYSEIDGLYVHDYIKQNKEKSVRWTATVHRIQDERTIELKEPYLPSILVTFERAIEEDIQIGDVVTIHGVLIGYGETFGADPIWVVRPAELVETTEEEVQQLVEYQEKAAEVE